MRTFLMLAACALLAGCAPSYVTGCPPVVEYGQDFQTRLADELAPLPNDDPIVVVVRDYKSLRDQVRACRGEG
ncbi:hypothetical protein FRZ44_37800 [Hypericibacter terrae]|uniref:Lipoprotein n=1 Tax=Hypericibacter terrae TaxID=2602015 RepID=A0A5J6MM76_9PROT|nr:hypothetical protein [Hypericibacter terrae]QEX18473.1 hypothetical protein FRZ44_37800 [Hypericibacter terrae]